MTRVAAIDCGTNSIRLLIADAGDGKLRDVTRQMRIVRLGQGVDRTGRLSGAAVERTRTALAEYCERITAHGAQRVRMVATSATRDAANRDEFTAMVHTTLGAEPEVISGDEEAALSFRGAVETIPGLSGEVVLADIGGGSTELVAGYADETTRLRSRSTDVGSVRMTERHLDDDPPSAAQVEALVSDVRTVFDAAATEIPLREAGVLIGVAGTVTTLAGIALGLREYRPEMIHGARIPAADVAEVTDRLCRMGHAQRAAIPVLHPGRVDVITAGALILRTLVELTGVREVIASEHDILDGIALSLTD